MTDKPFSNSELQQFVQRSIANPKLLERVRSFLGPDAISDARIRNWLQPDRGIPDQVVLGAALLMLADDEDLRVEDGKGPPASLKQEHRDALSRTKMWAKSAWHVFWIDDKGNHEGHDAHVWRFWDGLVSTVDEHRWFTHASIVEKDVDSVTIIPEEPQSLTSPRPSAQRIPNTTTISFQTPVTRTPQGIGYQFVSRPGVAAIAHDNQTHEFLGGVNVVPVLRSHFIVSIPMRLIADPYPPLLTFASFVSPLRLIEDLVQEDKIARLLDPTSAVHRFVQPWASIERSQLAVATDDEIPESLVRAVSKTWSGFPLATPSAGRRVVYASSRLPPPLAFQSFVYALFRKTQE